MSGGPGTSDPGRFTCRQYPLISLITRASIPPGLHHQTKDFIGYELVAAAGGPKLTPWAPDPNADASVGLMARVL
jgi:hypothetical protein